MEYMFHSFLIEILLFLYYKQIPNTMKTKNLLIFSLIASAFVLGSCSKDSSTPADLSTTDAQAEILSAQSSYDVETSAMDNTPGKMVYSHMAQLNLPFSVPSDGFFSSSSYIKSFPSRISGTNSSKFSSVQKALNFRSDFPFQTYVGTWEWNSQTQRFDHASSPTDKIIIEFPYPSTNSTNNAVYTISKYTVHYDVEMDEYSGDYVANITLDGNEIWSVNFSSSYTITDSYYDSKWNMTVKYAPYEYSESVEWKDDNSGVASAVATKIIKKDSQTLLAGTYNISVKYSDSNSDIDMGIKGDLTIANIRFHYETSYTGDDSNIEIKNNLKITVYNAAGAKVGEMKYFTNQNHDIVLMFYHNDSTSVEASTILGNIMEEWYSVYDSIMNNIGGAKK